MSRFGQWFAGLTQSSMVSVPCMIDLGSWQTRVLYNHKLVFQEPSCVAVHRPSGELLAIGQKAAEFIGKTPPSIEVVFPVRSGKIANIQVTQKFLKLIFARLPGKEYHALPFVGQTMTTALPSSTTQVQREVMKKIWQSLHINVLFQDKAVALMHRVQQLHQFAGVQFAVDVGAMSSEIAVWSDNQLVKHKTVMIGGEHLTQEIIFQVRKQYHCEVGWKTAELIKKEVAELPGPVAQNKKMVIRGRDTLSSLPSTIQISAEHFHAAAQNMAEEILLGFQQVCQEISPELLAQALERGVFLTGGGSVTPGLKEFLQLKLQTEVLVSPTPFEDVVRGI